MQFTQKFKPVYLPVSLLKLLGRDTDIPVNVREQLTTRKGNESKLESAFLGIEEFTTIERVMKTPDFSIGDCVFKIDLVIKVHSRFYGVQLKSSLCGIESHYKKYGNGLNGYGFSIACPIAIVPERSISFFTSFLDLLGASWKPESLVLLEKVRKLKKAKLPCIPLIMFSGYEKRLLSFLGYSIRDNKLFLKGGN